MNCYGSYNCQENAMIIQFSKDTSENLKSSIQSQLPQKKTLFQYT